MATEAQFRALEQAVNAQGQRLNAVTAELASVRRDIMRRTEQGASSTSFILPLLMFRKLSDELEGHTHAAAGNAVLPTSTTGTASGFLPLMFLMPGLFGGSGTSGATPGGSDSLNPFLLVMLLGELL